MTSLISRQLSDKPLELIFSYGMKNLEFEIQNMKIISINRKFLGFHWHLKLIDKNSFFGFVKFSF